MLSIAELIKASFTSKDACVEPHGGVYAPRLFTQQHSTTTQPLLYCLYDLTSRPLTHNLMLKLQRQQISR